MESLEKLCRLCADDLDVSMTLENYGELTKIQNIFDFVRTSFVYN